MEEIALNFDYDSDLVYSALIGNSSLNVSLVKNRFSRFFYPIDITHDARLRVGVYSEKGELEWVDEEKYRIEKGIGYFGPTEFFVDSQEPVLALKVNSSNKVALHWIMRILCSTVENSVQYTNNSIMFFRRNFWFGMRAPFEQHACGHFLGEGLEKGELSGSDFAMRDCEAAAVLSPNPEIYIAAGNNMKNVSEILKKAHYVGFDELKYRTSKRWESNERIKSSMVLSILQGTSGGVIAAPEFDPEYRYSGGYGYCWPRDASYIARAIDLLGNEQRAEDLLSWLGSVSNKGDFNQRYCLDGTFGPSWSNQVDQIGSFLWALLQHNKQYKDIGLLRKLFPRVEECAKKLSDFLYSPGISVDLWEERPGLHAYSCASIYAGLRGAHEIAQSLGMYKDNWIELSEELKKEFSKIFFDEEGILIRTINEDSADSVPDASLIGVSVPFGIVSPDDERMVRSIKVLEETLLLELGVIRYENDGYPKKGGIWPLCTAWLSWYYSQLGDKERATELLSLVEGSCNEHGFFPEQLGVDGKPRWVVPLAWSHAMYIIARDALKPRNE